jgi:hypothetical protein
LGILSLDLTEVSDFVDIWAFWWRRGVFGDFYMNLTEVRGECGEKAVAFWGFYFLVMLILILCDFGDNLALF